MYKLKEKQFTILYRMPDMTDFKFMIVFAHSLKAVINNCKWKKSEIGGEYAIIENNIIL